MPEILKTKDDGFHYSLYHPEENKPDALIVIFHGNNSSPYINYWKNRCRSLREAFPSASVIALEGPITYKKEKEFAWLKLSTKKDILIQYTKNLYKLPIVGKINTFIGNYAENYNLEANKIGLIGVSVGGMVAIQAAISNKQPYGAVLGMSTTVLPFSKYKLKSRPKIDLFMGKKDLIFNKQSKISDPVYKKLTARFGYSQLAQSERRLDEMGFEKIKPKIYKDSGHEVTEEMWSDGIECIGKRLGIKHGL